jgi:mRNA interferase RelE/StbE
MTRNYTLFLKSSAQKELDALSNPLFDRIDRKILILEADPRPTGAKKLRGHSDYWRIRIGDYRVIYVIDDTARRIDILRIAHRKEVYD